MMIQQTLLAIHNVTLIILLSLRKHVPKCYYQRQKFPKDGENDEKNKAEW